MKDSIYRAKERHSERRPGSDFHLRKIILTEVGEGWVVRPVHAMRTVQGRDDGSQT